MNFYWKSRFAAVCCCLLAAGGLNDSAKADASPGLELPFKENFSSPQLNPAWRQNVSPGSKISIKDNWITFEAQLSQQSHIERAAGADNITLSGKIVRWSGLYLVWDENNWCGIGKLSPTPFGRLYSITVINNRTNEVNHRGIDFNFPHNLRLQLGRDHVRFQYLLGNEWIELRTIERPKGFAGAPRLIRAGKYYGTEEAPYGVDPAKAKEAKVSGAIRELRVEATPKSELKLTKAELAAVRNPPGEPVNAVLAQTGDPTFEKIVGFYPPMKHPREIVGIPAHPLDIGVDRLGRLDVSPWTPPLAWFEVGEPARAFGEEGIPFTRRLLHGYLPVITLSRTIDGVDFQMTVFGWSENFDPGKELFAYVRFSASSDSAKQISLNWAEGKRVFPLKTMPGAAPQTFFRFKYPEPASATEISAAEFAEKEREVIARWGAKLKPAECFDIPDSRVSEAYRAWLVYSMLNADTINGHIEPHDGAGFYEEMFGCSVSLHSRALDYYGLHDYATQILDTQLHFQQTNGLYTQACGLTDPGSLLVALAKHYEMTGDRDWLERVSPNIIKQCEWLVREREKAPKDGMMRGLIKFRPYNDYPDPVYNFLGNAWCARGMTLAASVLKNVDPQKAGKFLREAEEYERDVLASMEATAVNDHGQTVLPMEPETHRLLKMSKYRGGDYYGLVACSLLETELLPPDDKRTSWIVDLVEKRGGLVAGVSEFQDGIDHAYTYGYLMNAMKRNEVRKTLLGFWSFLAFGMTRDTYSPVEVTMIETGENHFTLPHLYSCTEQLRLLRNLLFYENGSVLLIGQSTPRAWYQPGKSISVQEAPTEFGELSYRIDAVNPKQMRVSLTPPSRRPPSDIRLRLRHPQQWKIQSIQGLPMQNISFENDEIVLKEPTEPIDLDVRFGK